MDRPRRLSGDSHFPPPSVLSEQKQPHTESHSERCCDKPLIHLFVDLLLIHHSTPTNPRNHIRWDKMAMLPDGKKCKHTAVIGVKHMHCNLKRSQVHIIPSKIGKQALKFFHISFHQTVLLTVKPDPPASHSLACRKLMVCIFLHGSAKSQSRTWILRSS